jgi:hypothetical protein
VDAVASAAAAVASAVETDSSDSIDMSYKILPRPTIASEVKVVAIPMQLQLVLRLLLPTTPTHKQATSIQVKMHPTTAVQVETTLTPRQAVSTQELILLDTASVDQVKTISASR